jgi:hypothetical protein
LCLLIVAAVEDADAPAFGEAAGRPPEEVVVNLFRTGFLEREHLAPGGVHPCQDGSDGAVLAGGIHGLKDDQNGVTVACVKDLLQSIQLPDLFAQPPFALSLVRPIRRRFRRGLCISEGAVVGDEVWVTPGFKHERSSS